MLIHFSWHSEKEPCYHSSLSLFTYCFSECPKDIILNNLKPSTGVIWVCDGARIVRVVEVIFSAIINDLKSS